MHLMLLLFYDNPRSQQQQVSHVSVAPHAPLPAYHHCCICNVSSGTRPWLSQCAARSETCKPVPHPGSSSGCGLPAHPEAWRGNSIANDLSERM